MAQPLRALVALAEDPDLVPSTHVVGGSHPKLQFQDTWHLLDSGGMHSTHSGKSTEKRAYTSVVKHLPGVYEAPVMPSKKMRTKDNYHRDTGGYSLRTMFQVLGGKKWSLLSNLGHLVPRLHHT